MIIKNAKVNPIIGVEANSFDGKSVHVLTLLIEAKEINPEEFKNLRGKYNIRIEKEDEISNKYEYNVINIENPCILDNINKICVDGWELVSTCTLYSTLYFIIRRKI